MDIDTQTNDLFEAILEERLDDARSLLQGGASPDATNEFGMTVLATVASKGDKRACQLLLEHGADPSKKSLSGRAPLHEAARYGLTEIVELFLDYGADPNIKSADNETPIHCAASASGGLEACRLLVKHGADPEVKDVTKGTPLHKAAVANNLGTAEFLLKLGVFRDERNKNKETPLFMASINSHDAMCCLLVAYGSDAADDVLYKKLTPLKAAARGGFGERLVHLLENNPSSEPGDDIASLREYALRWNHEDTVAFVDAHIARKTLEKIIKAAKPGP